MKSVQAGDLGGTEFLNTVADLLLQSLLYQPVDGATVGVTEFVGDLLIRPAFQNQLDSTGTSIARQGLTAMPTTACGQRSTHRSVEDCRRSDSYIFGGPVPLVP